MPSTYLTTNLDNLKSRFITENSKSETLYTGRLQHLPNGHTRTTLHYSPFPVCFKSGSGCLLTSVDGKEYVDFLGEYTAGLFGHSHPVILEALRNTLSNGLNFGGVNEFEGQLAQKMCERFSLDRVRFTNSATEANMTALGAVKYLSGRPKVVVFSEGYHGGPLTFAGGAPGPINLPHEWVVAPYNDISATQKMLSSLPPDSVAAILVEPMQGAAGSYPASIEFLEYLRNTATSLGAVLIFDETMTSRLHWGGLQAQYNIKPDITCFGKYLAGGMSFGAFGGKKEIMDVFTTIAHSGTFNNNILSMTAGVTAFKILTPQVLDSMNTLGDNLRTGIEKLVEKTNGRVTVTGRGSLMSFHFFGKEGNAEEGKLMGELFFFYMLVEEGIYLAHRGFIALTIVHETSHITRFLQAVERFLEKHGELFV